jgi:fatty-acyl-CoA synthase
MLDRARERARAVSQQGALSRAAPSWNFARYLPKPSWGERSKAYMVLRAGTGANQQELIAHVRTKIAGYKPPREVDITIELPKTSTGKIQKFILRDKEWAGHG